MDKESIIGWGIRCEKYDIVNKLGWYEFLCRNCMKRQFEYADCEDKKNTFFASQIKCPNCRFKMDVFQVMQLDIGHIFMIEATCE